MRKNRQTRTLKICCIAIVSIFIFTSISWADWIRLKDNTGHHGKGWHKNDNGSNNNQDANVIPTSEGNPLINSSESLPKDHYMTISKQAEAIAEGLIKAGMSVDEIISTLTTAVEGCNMSIAHTAYLKACYKLKVKAQPPMELGGPKGIRLI